MRHALFAAVFAACLLPIPFAAAASTECLDGRETRHDEDVLGNGTLRTVVREIEWRDCDGTARDISVTTTREAFVDAPEGFCEEDREAVSHERLLANGTLVERWELTTERDCPGSARDLETDDGGRRFLPAALPDAPCLESWAFSLTQGRGTNGTVSTTVVRVAGVDCPGTARDASTRTATVLWDEDASSRACLVTDGRAHAERLLPNGTLLVEDRRALASDCPGTTKDTTASTLAVRYVALGAEVPAPVATPAAHGDGGECVVTHRRWTEVEVHEGTSYTFHHHEKTKDCPGTARDEVTHTKKAHGPWWKARWGWRT